MKPRRATFFLLATLGSIASCQMPNGPRLSALYDRYGQSPCSLEERVKGACPQPSDSDIPAISLNQSAQPCTCNIVFFNLWSACLLSVGNSVLPTFDQWSESCSNSSLDINNCPPEVNAIPLPPWVRMVKPNPTNTTFDVGNAIMIAQVSKGMPWTPVQIMMPVLSAIAMFVILGSWYLYQYSTRQYKAPWSRDGTPFFYRHSARKVTERSRNEAWTIDLNESPVNQYIPKGHSWLDDPASKRVTCPPPGQGHCHAPSTDSSTKFGSWNSLLQFNRPPTLRSVTPGKGWRISSIDHSTESGPSPKPALSRPAFGHVVVEDDSGDEDATGGPRHETDELLSPAARSENTVFLISHRAGEDFTIESSLPSRSSSLGTSQGGTHSSQQRPVIDPPGEQSNIPSSLRPSNHSTQDFSKSFSFLHKFKITMPGKSSRSYSNKQNPPPSRALTAENASLPSARSRQVSPFPEVLPLAPSPLVHSRSANLVTGYEQTSSYPQLHPNRPQGTPSPFQSIHQQRLSREEITFFGPQWSHRRAASHDIYGTRPAMLYPGSPVHSASHARLSA